MMRADFTPELLKLLDEVEKVLPTNPDTGEAEGVRTMAILCRVLDSVKSRFGILFSKSGVSGGGKWKDAELEQLKIFQDRGTVIVVIDRDDLDELGRGANVVSLLRKKYERVRLNLRGT